MANTVEDALVVRMEASLRKFERQMEAGRAAAVKAATGSENAWKRSSSQITANANRAATGLQRMTNISGRGRFVLQNTANQIGDIAVQMGSGTSASRALGQQLPQLFGGFGALGGALGLVGPLMGTVAALAIPLGAAFLMSSEKAEGLDDQLKELSESLAALESAQKRASMSAIDLVNDYGGMADEARALFEIEKQMAQIRAQAALDDASRGIAGELGVGGAMEFAPDSIRNLEATIDQLREERSKIDEATRNLSDQELRAATDRIAEIKDQIGGLSQVSRNLDDLADNLGITEEAAREVAAQFAAIGQADNTKERASAMQDLVSYIKDSSDNLADAEDEGKALYGQLLEASLKALELSKVDMAGNISTAADEAARLAENLAAARGAQVDALTGDNPDFFDPRNESGNSGRIIRDRGVPEENRPGYEPPKTRNGRSGGGGGGRVDPRIAEAARIYTQTRTEVEKYNIELEKLNQLREAGFISENTHMRAVEDLGEQLKETTNIGKKMGDEISGALADMVVDFDNARDAAAGLLQNLARMFANSAFQSLGLDSLFGGIFGSAKGNVFSGGRPVHAFANGGIVSGPTMFPMRGNQTGLMGEAGPEAIMPLTRTANGKLGVQAQGANGGKQQIEIIMRAPEGFTASQVQQVQGISLRVSETSIRENGRQQSDMQYLRGGQ